MANTESVSHGDLVVCACGDREFTARDAMEAALFRGELDGPWREFLGRFAAAERADESELDLDEGAFDAAAESFRYEHDLITAEETEHWLAARGLALDDFSDYFVRQCWGNNPPEDTQTPETSYGSASGDLRDTLMIDLILSGQLDRQTTQLAWRLAAAAATKDVDLALIEADKKNFLERHNLTAEQLPAWLEQIGRDAEWLDRHVAMEAAYRARSESLFAPNTYAKELTSLRLPLTRFETEVMELESRDAAQEALFCVREDGMSMEEVATESRYPYRRLQFLLEDLEEEVQQRFLSVTPGQVLEPIAQGDGFQLCRISSRAEPQTDDPVIRARIEQRVLQRHFSELASKHVERRLGAALAPE